MLLFYSQETYLYDNINNKSNKNLVIPKNYDSQVHDF